MLGSAVRDVPAGKPVTSDATAGDTDARYAALGCFGSFTPVASTPSNVQLLSSTERPTNRIEVCVPAPVLIAPGASIIRLDQCRPLSGSSLSCADWTTVDSSGDVLSTSGAAPSTVTTSCNGPTSSLMSSVRRSPTSNV